MRHKMSGRKLGGDSSYRKALLMNLANSLIDAERIKTTLPKAKELRPYLEKIITVSKTDTLHGRRQVLAVLRNEDSVRKLFGTIGPRMKDRSGGYLRILKCGFRSGDAADMAIIEFVDNEIK